MNLSKIKYFGFLSFDVVLGALASAVMAVKLLNVQMPGYWWLILGTAVWLVYMIDHLLDAIKMKNKPQAERRRFINRNFMGLSIAVLLVGLFDLFLSVYYFKKDVLYSGLLIGLIITGYFLLINFFKIKQKILLQKEFIVALIYTAGIYIAPLLRIDFLINTVQFILIVCFFLLVWSDILLIALFEYEKDLHDHFKSFPVLYGKQITQTLIKIILFVVLLALIAVNLFFKYNKLFFASSIILACIAALQFFLLEKKSFYCKNDTYRIITEGMFYLPALLFIF